MPNYEECSAVTDMPATSVANKTASVRRALFSHGWLTFAAAAIVFSRTSNFNSVGVCSGSVAHRYSIGTQSYTKMLFYVIYFLIFSRFSFLFWFCFWCLCTRKCDECVDAPAPPTIYQWNRNNRIIGDSIYSHTALCVFVEHTAVNFPFFVCFTFAFSFM